MTCAAGIASFVLFCTYCWGDEKRRMREAGHIERVGEVTYVLSSSVRNPEGKKETI